jgi:DNA-damage-inducible protein D
MERKRATGTGLKGLLGSDAIRRFDREGRTVYAAADVVAYLNEGESSRTSWAELKHREAGLARMAEVVEVPAAADEATEPPASTNPRQTPERVDAVDLAGVMRLVQTVRSPLADRLRAAVATAAAEWVNEDDNPELAALRARRTYEARGFRRRWVEKRLRGAGARQEATAEWYKRGATASDQFRALTNAIVEEAFGMDVTAFRARKGLTRTSESLRDHMTDVELALTELGETLAVSLHRGRGSQGVEQLEQDARDAGRIVARTRAEVETQLGRPVVEGVRDLEGEARPAVETPRMSA